MSTPSPVIAGLRLRCPRCGQGRLFRSYLKFADRCAACDADFALEDAGDGPAVFVMFLVGALVVPLAFILDFRFGLPGWATLSISALATIALSLVLLPRFKGALFALQWRHDAGAARTPATDGD